jgi:phosphatidylserine/phosphatidylglycerophosphate/cardiolipin synthase-like enzyme
MKKLLLLFGLLIFSVPRSGHASEVIFSPDGGVREEILKRIHQSKVTIDVSMFVFTSTPMAEALIDAHKRGVRVRVLRDRNQSKIADDRNADLQHYGVLVHLLTGPGDEGLMHNTFAIFDDKEVFVGSYNWTPNAESRNWENALFVDDKKVVKSYKKQFERLWKVPDKGI